MPRRGSGWGVRQFLLVVHRWLGLMTAPAVLILAVTGLPLLWLTPSTARAIAGRIHTDFAMGRPGEFVVVGFTLATAIVIVCGLPLWWKRKIVAVRSGGSQQLMFDLHHTVGVFGFLFMLMSAVTGVLEQLPRQEQGLLSLVDPLHTARNGSFAVRLLYTAGLAAFIVQAATGCVMWWGRRRRGGFER
jgi:uncharacterized iron-regulated membrane protein